MKPIESTNYDGSIMRLTHSLTGQYVHAGEIVSTMRGDEAQVLGGTAPRKPGSTGRVSTDIGVYYPSVFGLHWAIVPVPKL